VTHCDDGEDSIWHPGYSALVAVRAVDGPLDWWVYFHHLVCWKDLPHGYFDVWEKAELERDVEMGSEEIALLYDILKLNQQWLGFFVSNLKKVSFLGRVCLNDPAAEIRGLFLKFNFMITESVQVALKIEHG
jgi:hypothetical protein